MSHEVPLQPDPLVEAKEKMENIEIGFTANEWKTIRYALGKAWGANFEADELAKKITEKIGVDE